MGGVGGGVYREIYMDGVWVANIVVKYSALNLCGRWSAMQSSVLFDNNI